MENVTFHLFFFFFSLFFVTDEQEAGLLHLHLSGNSTATLKILCVACADRKFANLVAEESTGFAEPKDKTQSHATMHIWTV